VAGLAALLDALLNFVPANASTPAQREAWAQLRAAVPPLPTRPDPARPGELLLAPAEVMCTAGSNPVESPELYAVHPYRRLTVGRAAAAQRAAAAPAVNLSAARASFAADPHANTDNHDWNQGVMNAALLGLTPDAARLLSQRALTGPAPGYRWPGFAPAIYDYAPVSELHAGLMSAANWMLLQPGDDAAGTFVLLPAWPCEWDVELVLWAPLATRVELRLVGGAVARFDVTPPARAAAAVWAGCVAADEVGEGRRLPGSVLRAE